MKLHKKRNKIIVFSTVAILLIIIISVLLLFSWCNRYDDSFSFEIDPDEIYQINWWSIFGSESWTVSREVTDRDEIKAIVAHLNAWSVMTSQHPGTHRIGGETPNMQITLLDEAGNRKWGWSVRGRFLQNADGWHVIICERQPERRFVRRFE